MKYPEEFLIFMFSFYVIHTPIKRFNNSFFANSSCAVHFCRSWIKMDEHTFSIFLLFFDNPRNPSGYFI